MGLLPAREANEDSRYERRIGCHAQMDQTLGSRVPNGSSGKQLICKHIVEVQSQLKATPGRSDKPHLEPSMTIIEITSDSPGWYW